MAQITHGNYNPQYQQQQTYAYSPSPKKMKPVWPWIVGFVVILVGLLIWAVIVGSPNMDESAAAWQDMDASYVAVLHVEGTMLASSAGGYSTYTDGYDHQYLLDTIDGLIADQQNRGLLLYIDSPGGELLACAELGDKVVEYKETTGRPVFAYGHNYAASGGYWVAAAADEFYMNQYGITGSIGVTYGTLFDFSGLLEKYGVKTNTLTSGAQKSMGSYWEEMGEETRAIFQSIIDEYYGYFIDWICDQRDMPRTQLLALADGRIYTATQAVENGLADFVGDEEDCLAALLTQCGTDCTVYDYYPEVEMSLSELLWGASSDDSEIHALLSILPPSGVLAYYYQ